MIAETSNKLAPDMGPLGLPGRAVMTPVDGAFYLEEKAMDGLCECGCGGKTKVCRGKQNRYINKHQTLGKRGPTTNNWKRGGYESQGKKFTRMMDHPNAINGGYVLEHRLIAERVLGKTLPRKAIIHHYGEKRDDLKIVICENQSYHMLLHHRETALKECGHISWRKCTFCHSYDSPDNLISYLGQRNAFHRECKQKYQRAYYRRNHGTV